MPRLPHAPPDHPTTPLPPSTADHTPTTPRGRRPRLRRPLCIALAVLSLALALRLSWLGSARVRSGSMIPTLRVGDRVLVDRTAYGWRVPGTDRWLTDIETPSRGEIVVFTYPYDDGSGSVGHDMIKRVVGLPGDRLRIRADRLLLDGRPLPRRHVETRGPCDAPADHRCDDARECLGTFAYIVRRHLPIAGQANTTRAPSSWPPRIFNPVRLTRNARPYTPPANADWPDYVVPRGRLLVLGDNRDVSRDGRQFGLVPLQALIGRAYRVWYAPRPGSWLPDPERTAMSLHRPATRQACAPP